MRDHASFLEHWGRPEPTRTIPLPEAMEKLAAYRLGIWVEAAHEAEVSQRERDLILEVLRLMRRHLNEIAKGASQQATDSDWLRETGDEYLKQLDLRIGHAVGVEPLRSLQSRAGIVSHQVHMIAGMLCERPAGVSKWLEAVNQLALMDLLEREARRALSEMQLVAETDASIRDRRVMLWLAAIRGRRAFRSKLSERKRRVLDDGSRSVRNLQ